MNIMFCVLFCLHAFTVLKVLEPLLFIFLFILHVAPSLHQPVRLDVCVCVCVDPGAWRTHPYTVLLKWSVSPPEPAFLPENFKKKDVVEILSHKKAYNACEYDQKNGCRLCIHTHTHTQFWYFSSRIPKDRFRLHRLLA